MTIGGPFIRWRWWILTGWVVGGAALTVLVPPLDPSVNERTSFLPDETPYSQAVVAMRESFPRNSWRSEAVVVFERRGGALTKEDLAAVERIAERIPRPGRFAGAADLAEIRIRSPRSIPLNPNPLKSPLTDAGQAALIKVGIPANFITLQSNRIVDHIHDVIGSAPRPEGLDVSVTGSSGFGHDYADAAERSHTRTLHVTLIAVIVILLMVYRAPVAALIPLAAISAAAFVALKILAIGQQFGMHVGTAERIFVIVLLYGAGTDYSLFFISRFREFLDEGMSGPDASSRALDATFPAILASAGTDTAGLLMLCFAGYGIFRTTGPAVAVALAVALLAAVTLVPVGAAIAGGRLFWPAKVGEKGRRGLLGLGKRRLWPLIARLVTGRPGWVLAAVIIVLAVPALRGARLTWVYDTLTELRRDPDADVHNAAVGIDAARRHWPVGEIAPVHVLVRSDSPLSEAKWREFSGDLTRALGELESVRTVRSLTRPVGEPLEGLSGVLLQTVGWAKIREEYLSEDMRAARIAVVLDSPAFSLKAMDAVGRIRTTVERERSGADIGGELHIAGATAEMIDIRSVTQADFYRVAALSLGVIFLMIVVLLRDAILSLVMVGSTILSYFATLGLSYWVFAGLLGGGGLDWKVEVFLFVVMVAVGVDYNIFLASRLAQERRRLPVKLAVARAVIHTGPVISSCGVIMAATLGSLMAGDLTLLHQLGFALALGMLIDTFLIRPLFLPAFVALTGRTGRALNLGH